MPRKSKRKRWSLQEVSNLKKYIQSKAELLTRNFYENVVEGKMKIRKPPGFFIQMAETLQMTPKQCKSKFQKFEMEIYTNYLGLPGDEYRVFVHLRKRNFFNKNFKGFYRSKGTGAGKIIPANKNQEIQFSTEVQRKRRAQVKKKTEKREPSKRGNQNWSRRKLIDLRKQMIEKFELKKAQELKESESNFLKQKQLFKQKDSNSEEIGNAEEFWKIKNPFLRPKLSAGPWAKGGEGLRNSVSLKAEENAGKEDKSKAVRGKSSNKIGAKDDYYCLLQAG